MKNDVFLFFKLYFVFYCVYLYITFYNEPDWMLMRRFLKTLLLSTSLGMIVVLQANTEPQQVDFTTRQAVKTFIEQVAKEDKFEKKSLEALFSSVKIQKRSLRYYAKKPKPSVSEKKKKPKTYHGSWSRYERKLLNDERVRQGIMFMQAHHKDLAKAQERYGVPAEYITAIIGIETYYGRYTGDYPVFDTLSTLAFEKNRRNDFFRDELREFLKMTRKEGLDPKSLHGSFAGAIGLGQFMPSNFERHGVDFDGDGRLRISQPSDAIGSIANYFKASGWQTDVPVATRVNYDGVRFDRFKTGYEHTYHRKDLTGIYPKERFYYADPVRLIKLNRVKYDELWYGTQNFYVITRYNHSSYYAMAVHQLAQRIKDSVLTGQKKPELIAMLSAR